MLLLKNNEENGNFLNAKIRATGGGGAESPLPHYSCTKMENFQNTALIQYLTYPGIL